MAVKKFKCKKLIGDKMLQIATYGHSMQTTICCKLQRMVAPCKRPNAAKKCASYCRKRPYDAKVAYLHLQHEVVPPPPCRLTTRRSKLQRMVAPCKRPNAAQVATKRCTDNDKTLQKKMHHNVVNDNMLQE